MNELMEKLRKAADWGEDEFDVLSPQDAAAIVDRIEALEAENFKLAAGACNVEGGLVGDEHGHFDCSLKARIEALERELAEAVAVERERCARIAERWRDENKAAAAEARKRTRALAGTPFEDPDMADMLDGAAIECNAIAAAIRNGERG